MLSWCLLWTVSIPCERGILVFYPADHEPHCLLSWCLWSGPGCAVPQVLNILGDTFPAVAVYFLDVIVVKIFVGLTFEVSIETEYHTYIEGSFVHGYGAFQWNYPFVFPRIFDGQVYCGCCFCFCCSCCCPAWGAQRSLSARIWNSPMVVLLQSHPRIYVCPFPPFHVRLLRAGGSAWCPTALAGVASDPRAMVSAVYKPGVRD